MVTFTCFSAVSCLYAWSLWLALPESLLLGALAVLLGLGGVTASAWIYRVPARPAWQSKHTVAEFFLSGALLGPLFVGSTDVALSRPLLFVSIAAAGAQLLNQAARQALHPRSQSQSRLQPDGRTGWRSALGRHRRGNRAAAENRGWRSAVRASDDSHRGGRPRRQPVDRVRRGLHVCVRSRRRQDPDGAIPRRRHRVTDQPLLRRKRSSALRLAKVTRNPCNPFSATNRSARFQSWIKTSCKTSSISPSSCRTLRITARSVDS